MSSDGTDYFVGMCIADAASADDHVKTNLNKVPPGGPSKVAVFKAGFEGFQLDIAETEPGIQGDRVSGATKPATLETGLVVQVPLFINPGEKVKVDTRSGEYLSRA